MNRIPPNISQMVKVISKLNTAVIDNDCDILLNEAIFESTSLSDLMLAKSSRKSAVIVFKVSIPLLTIGSDVDKIFEYAGMVLKFL